MMPAKEQDLSFLKLKMWEQRHSFDAGVLVNSKAEQVLWLRLLYQARMRHQTLPQIWSTAWQLAFGSLPEAQAHAQELAYAMGLDLATQVQKDMGNKHPYHNAAHAGDVLILMAALLRAWRDWSILTDAHAHTHSGQFDHDFQLPGWDSTLAFLCLLCALTHDWGHDGGGNTLRGKRLEDEALGRLEMGIEHWFRAKSKRTEQFMRIDSDAQTSTPEVPSYAQPQQVAQLLGVQWKEHLYELFNVTDMREWRKYHEQYALESKRAWIKIEPITLGCALMIEADIGASMLPAHGHFLNGQIDKEAYRAMLHKSGLTAKRNINNQGKPAQTKSKAVSKIVATRLSFLLGVSFSTPMAWQLGLPQLKQSTIMLLKPKDMNLLSYAELLSRQTLFAKLRSHELQQLAQITIKMKLKKGQTLVKQGASTEALYVVLTGRAVVLTRDKEGREIILNQVAANEYIGELHVVDGTAHSADVVAMTNMDVLRLERKALLECMMGNPLLSLSMLSGLANRLRLSDERVRSLAYQNTSERLVQVIKNFPNQKLSATYLAKSVGCSRETAGRLLADLQHKGKLAHTAVGWQVIEN